MLVIRGDQLVLLERGLADRFAREAASFLRRCFPAALSETAEPDLLSWVTRQRVRAAAWGIVQAHDLRLLLSLGVVLGRDFLEASRHGWARTILQGDGPPSQRVNRVYKRAVAELDAAEQDQDARDRFASEAAAYRAAIRLP